MRRPGRSRQRGAAVPLAVVAIMILLAMGVGFLSLGRTARVYAVRNASNIAARCAADAGLTMALFEMNEKLRVKPWNEGTLPEVTDMKLPCYDAVCSYRVTGSLAGGYTIQSSGRSGESNRNVSATIKLRGAFDDAILTRQQLVLKSDTTIDGYNSLDPTDSDIVIDIGSQSNAKDSVILNMGVEVKGDVFVAPGADLNAAIRDHGSIMGERYTSAPKPLPPVIAPTLPSKPAIGITGETITLTPADSGSYPEIYLRQEQLTEEVIVDKGGNQTTETVVIGTVPSVLEISGGCVVLHLTGDIQLGNSCEIIIRDGSTLTIYTDGNIHCRMGSSVGPENPTRRVETLQIYATGQDAQYFDIKAKSEFTGKIYAPNADVDLYAKGDVYGAVVADSFNFNNGGDFYYDEALRENISVNDEAVVFSIARWREGKSNTYALAEKLALPGPY